MHHTSFVHFFAVVLQDSGVGGEIRNSFQNIQIWRRNKIKYRKGKLAKQNENYQKHWADVEWHKSGAITIKTQILSQELQRASITCRQNINFWFRSHVCQSSELCHFHISHNTLCLHVSCPPTAQTVCISIVFIFYAKRFACVGEQETRKQSVLWKMWKWRITVLKSKKKNLRIQTYPDTCGRCFTLVFNVELRNGLSIQASGSSWKRANRGHDRHYSNTYSSASSS